MYFKQRNSLDDLLDSFYTTDGYTKESRVFIVYKEPHVGTQIHSFFHSM